jgi:hypothetical protein
MDIDNLFSFSSVVNEIQHDKNLAKKNLILVYEETLRRKEEIARLETELERKKNSLKLCEGVTDNIFRHMKFNFPMSLITDKGILTITETEYFLEKNVL